MSVRMRTANPSFTFSDRLQPPKTATCHIGPGFALALSWIFNAKRNPVYDS